MLNPFQETNHHTTHNNETEPPVYLAMLIKESQSIRSKHKTIAAQVHGSDFVNFDTLEI